MPTKVGPKKLCVGYIKHNMVCFILENLIMGDTVNASISEVLCCNSYLFEMRVLVSEITLYFYFSVGRGVMGSGF